MVKTWMLNNLDRHHFLIPAGQPAVLNALEVYIRARVGSVFEGSAYLASSPIDSLRSWSPPT